MCILIEFRGLITIRELFRKKAVEAPWTWMTPPAWTSVSLITAALTSGRLMQSLFDDLKRCKGNEFQDKCFRRLEHGLM